MLNTCHQCKKSFEKEQRTTFCSEECKAEWVGTLPLLDCKACGEKFRQIRKGILHCSIACRKKTVYAKMRTLSAKECKGCKATFVPTLTKKLYCSDECASATKPKKSNVFPEKECELCKKTFKPAQKGQRFDTVECRANARYNNKICKVCSTKFYKKGTERCCSLQCLRSFEQTEQKRIALELEKASTIPNNGEASTRKEPKLIDYKATLKVLESLLSAIDATGGIFIDTSGLYSLVMDEEAFGIADAYTKACSVIGRLPQVEVDPRTLGDCRVCGTYTSSQYRNVCGCFGFYCKECKANAGVETCIKHKKKVIEKLDVQTTAA